MASPPNRSGRLILAGALLALLAACHAAPGPHARGPRTARDASASGLGHAGVGGSVLASVENARAALALHDEVAASNDVDRALSDASQLPELPSPLFPDGGVSNQGGQGALTDFALRVDLANIQTDLQNGDLEAAGAGLSAVQQAVPQNLAPQDLPLLQASESLDFAQSALSNGQSSELHTQLASAQLALSHYAGPAHARQAQALAAAIKKSLAGPPESLGLFQPSEWKGEVDGWG